MTSYRTSLVPISHSEEIILFPVDPRVLVYRIERSHLPCNRSLSSRISLLCFPHNITRARNKHETSTITVGHRWLISASFYMAHVRQAAYYIEGKDEFDEYMRFVLCMCAVFMPLGHKFYHKSQVKQTFGDTGSIIVALMNLYFGSKEYSELLILMSLARWTERER